MELIYAGKVLYFNAAAHPLRQYGGGLGPIHFSHVGCTGSETQLVECVVAMTSGETISKCSHSNDAGVNCPGIYM